MNRKQPIKVGNLVWIERCKANDLLSGLPEGLNDGRQVRVLGYSPDKLVKIRTEDARAKAYIKRMVGEIARDVHPCYPDLSHDQTTQWRGILARNRAA